MKKNQYSKDIDTLIPLVSYLALCQYKSMRPSAIAKRLSLSTEAVMNILEKYKGIFRKSFRVDTKSGEHYYTLHMRYALRWEEGDLADQENQQVPPLTSEQFNSLIKFITDKAAQEDGIRIEKIKNWITMFAALIAAIAAIIGSILK